MICDSEKRRRVRKVLFLALYCECFDGYSYSGTKKVITQQILFTTQLCTCHNSTLYYVHITKIKEIMISYILDNPFYKSIQSNQKCIVRTVNVFLHPTLSTFTASVI